MRWKKNRGGKIESNLTIKDVKIELKKSLEPLHGLLLSTIKTVKEMVSPITEKIERLEEEINYKKEQLEKSIERGDLFEKKFRDFENQPIGRKSVQSAGALERFEKSAQPEQLDASSYDMSNIDARRNLSAVLFEHYKVGADNGKPNEVLEKSIRTVELMGSVPREAVPILTSLGIRVINNQFEGQ